MTQTRNLQNLSFTEAEDLVNDLTDADIVFCCFTDGTSCIVKGTELMKAIIREDRSQKVSIMTLGLTTHEQADVIEAAIQVINEGQMDKGAILTFAQLLRKVVRH